MIALGPRSILLLIGTTHALVLAALLLRVPANRTANRLLALLLSLVALRVVPYIIGFAGFYDAWPWLTYLPYEYSLGYGAVIWLYVRVICTGALPSGWRWHLMPAGAQGVYYCALFVHTNAWKDQWNASIHEPVVVPIESAWALIAMAGYLILAWREYVRYQRWLDADLSNREEFRLNWLRIFILVLGVTLVFSAGTALYESLIAALSYFDRFPLYLWFSVLIYGLGIGGLRNASLAYPRTSVMDAVPLAQTVETTTPERLPTNVSRPTDRQPDWAAMGDKWRQQVHEKGWWRDPDLTAPLLARHLATNTSYLSRALNDGLGQNFNEFVNGIRVRAVQAELAQPDRTRDVLAIALDAGFNSKASFNRVFKRLSGETPTEFRRRHGLGTSQLQ